MKAKDIMIPFQDYLKPEDTLSTAVNLFKTARRGEQQKGVMGLPVLDEKGNLVGMLSMMDILRAVYPSYMSMMDLGDFTWDGMLESFAKQAGNKKVKDLMTRNVVTIREDDPLMECVDHMLKNRVRRLPVLDKTGKVVGMLYVREIFFAITKAIFEEDNRGVK